MCLGNDYEFAARLTKSTKCSRSINSPCTGGAVAVRTRRGGLGLLEQVVNNCLLLPVDPAGEEENNERERRRQRVHVVSVPERLTQCKAHQIRDRRYPAPGPFCLIISMSRTASVRG